MADTFWNQALGESQPEAVQVLEALGASLAPAISVLHGVPQADILVIDPDIGFCCVLLTPPPDLASAIERTRRAVTLVAKPANQADLGAFTALVIGDEAPEGCKRVAFGDLGDGSGLAAAYGDVVDAIDESRARGVKAGAPVAALEALVLAHKLEPREPAPAPAIAAASARPAPAPSPSAVAKPAHLHEAADRLRATEAAPQPPRPLNRHLRALDRRLTGEAERRLAARQALVPFENVGRGIPLKLPPASLEGAGEMRMGHSERLLGFPADELVEIAAATLAALRDGERSDVDRPALLDGLDMLRDIGRMRGLALGLPPGQRENRAINARIALASACAGHYSNYDLAAARILARYEALASIDAVVAEIERGPQAFGKVRDALRRKPSARRVQKSLAGARTASRKERPASPAFRSIAATLVEIRRALEQLRQTSSNASPDAAAEQAGAA